MNIFEHIGTFGSDSIKPEGKRGVKAGKLFRPKEPTEATMTQPGSEERIRVYQQRIQNGESVFAEGDYRIEAPVGWRLRPEEVSSRYCSKAWS